VLRILAIVLATTSLVSCVQPGGVSRFQQWLATSPGRAEAFERFEATLTEAGVSDVVANDQLWIVDQLKPACASEPYQAPPEALWPNIIATLEFVRDHVKPTIGDVEVVSGYRNPAFNECIGGASESAHRSYHALDLVPADESIDRSALIARLCAVHAREGPRAMAGLGIYSGRRFHIDTRGYRGWGADHRGASFPCRDLDHSPQSERPS
jgi:hypothetical protein